MRFARVKQIIGLAGCLWLAVACSEPTPSGTGRSALESGKPLAADSSARQRLAALRGSFPAAFDRVPDDAIERFVHEPSGRIHALLRPSARASALRAARVELPFSADGAARVQDERSGRAIELTLEGARPSAAAVADGLAVYEDATEDGFDLVHRVGAEGTEDFVFLPRAPSRGWIAYRVDVSGIPGMRLVSNTLEFVDGDGTPVLRMAPPYVVAADGTRREALTRVVGCAYDTDPQAPFGRSVTPPGAESCGVEISWADLPYPAVLDPAWTATGNMARARQKFIAIAVPGQTNQVLVAGGRGATGVLKEAELFSNLAFAATGSMQDPRQDFAADTYATAQVLVCGGQSTNNLVLDTSETFSAGVWTRRGAMGQQRYGHTLTRLPNGQVLVAGGTSGVGVVLTTAETYNAGNWTARDAMVRKRTRHASAMGSDGKLYVFGGWNGDAASNGHTSVEYYDPTANLWTELATGMPVPRYDHTATPYSGGARVLVAGGYGGSYLNTANVFDVATKAFVASPTMAGARSAHTATLLSTSKILIAGGFNGTNALPAAELFFQASNTFAPVSAMTGQRYDHAAAPYGGGALVAGGFAAGAALATANVFVPIAQGGACNASYPADCVSAICVDGVCCDKACADKCDQCNGATPGVCTAMPLGNPGSPACGAYVCDGASTACPATCASDANCASTHWCSATACVAKKANGVACTGGNQCSSGNCVDGVCCDKACGDKCDRCNGSVPGSCQPMPAGSAGIPACGAYLCNGTSTACPTTCASDASCAGAYWCSGTSCVAKKANGLACTGGNQCTSGNCVDGVCCDKACADKCDRCNGTTLGACAPMPAGNAGNPACGAYVCNGTATACPSTCSTDANCASTHWCSGTTCVAKKGTGIACTGANQCTSGNCVDGVCCNLACGDKCDRCNGTTLGTCAPMPAGNAGNPACGAYLCNGSATACPTTCASDANCASTHWCSGTTCVSKKANGVACTGGNQCTSGNCVDGVCCNLACGDKCDRCNGTPLGTCNPMPAAHVGSPACGAYVCNGTSTACPTTCTSDANCASGYWCSGTACVLKKANSVACTGGNQCTSGNCVDGVCCDTSCSGKCDSCNLSGKLGACTVFPEGNAGAPSCAPYACTGLNNACATACAKDAHCASTHWCSGTACVLKKTNGQSCTGPNQCATGNCVDGVCCDKACGLACDVCNKAGAVGTCSPAPIETASTCAPYACNGTSTSCPTSCTEDRHCAATHYCGVGGVCTPRRSPGGACDQQAGLLCLQQGCRICNPNYCVDGYCCDKACGESCDQCNKAGALGRCSNRNTGEPGVPVCGNGADCNIGSAVCPLACARDADCGNGYFCGSDRLCHAQKGLGETCSTAAAVDCLNAGCPVCATGFCVDGVCCDGACDAPCDGCRGVAPGYCLPLDRGTAAPTCAPYSCSGTAVACPSSCANHLDCAATHYCNGGACQPKTPRGQSCAIDDECVSGHCANGICCDSACGEECNRCDQSGWAGTCRVVPPGDAGGPSCEPYLCDGASATCPRQCATDAACAAGYFCSNLGACTQQRTNGQTCDLTADCSVRGSCRECLSGNCVDGRCCNDPCSGGCDSCDATGTCSITKDAVPASCPTYRCAGDSPDCPTGCSDDSACADSAYCANSACTPKHALGAGCAEDRECSSGQCSDGVCCSSDCSGACDRCSAGGRCDFFVGSGEPACAGGFLCSGGAADCPTSCANSAACEQGYFCNAAKACEAKRPQGAGCSAGDECISAACADGVCCERACSGACEACSTEGLCRAVGSERTCSGASKDGAYLCRAGLADCPGECGADADCASGFFCNANRQCEPQRGLGKSCAAADCLGADCRQCAEGRPCVDGFCCESACDKPCDGCKAEPGLCRPLAAGTPGCDENLVCDGSSAECPAGCDAPTDCVAGSYCADGRCVLGAEPLAAEVAADLYSCGCGSSGAGALPWAALALLLAFRRSRRAARVALPLLAVLALLAPRQASAQALSAKVERPSQRLKIAVFTLEAGDKIDPKLCELVTENLVAQLQQRPGVQTLSSKDVSTVLNLERQRQLLGCTESNCLAEIGGALGADRLVSGSLARLGDTAVLNVQMFNLRKTAIEKRHTARLDGNSADEEFLDAAVAAADVLLPCPDCARPKPSLGARYLLKARGQVQPVAHLSGAGALLGGYRFTRALSLEAGALLAGRSPGAMARLAYVPFAAKRPLHPVVGLEVPVLFAKEGTAVGAGLSVGGEYRLGSRVVLGVDVPVVAYLKAPDDKRALYLFLAGSAAVLF